MEFWSLHILTGSWYERSQNSSYRFPFVISSLIPYSNPGSIGLSAQGLCTIMYFVQGRMGRVGYIGEFFGYFF